MRIKRITPPVPWRSSHSTPDPISGANTGVMMARMDVMKRKPITNFSARYFASSSDALKKRRKKKKKQIVKKC